MHSRHSAGFTLVELMVVITIVAILAAVAAPSYRDMIDRYRLRSAADDVISVISNARAGSVKLHREVNVSFVTGAAWCAGANAAAAPAAGSQAAAAAACACGTAGACSVGGENLVVPVGKHPGVQMTNTPASFVFDGVVGVTTGLATRTVSLRSPLQIYTLEVNVTPLGQANACARTTAMVGYPLCP